GVGVEENISRRLEHGVLPILNSTLTDDDILYRSSSFVSLENAPLSVEAGIGTDYLIANSHSGGRMLTESQKELLAKKQGQATASNEETVLYFRSEAINTGKVPRYAWFKAPRPGNAWYNGGEYVFDPVTGFSSYPSGAVFCISKLNDLPLK